MIFDLDVSNAKRVGRLKQLVEPYALTRIVVELSRILCLNRPNSVNIEFELNV